MLHLFKTGLFTLLGFAIGMHLVSALTTRRSLSFLCRKSSASIRTFSSTTMHPPKRHLNGMSSAQDDQAALTERLAKELVNNQPKSVRPIRACLGIAGGGSNAASAVASIPGASSLLLESVVTYDRRSFAEFVSQNVDVETMESTSEYSSNDGSSADNNDSFHFCSAQAAILLSKSALNRSLKLSPSFQDRCLNCIGVGSASTLVGLPSQNPDDNERRRKRKSRAYVACSSLKVGTIVWEVELANGLEHQSSDIHLQHLDLQSRRTRAQEEAVVSNLILASMMESQQSSGSRLETRNQLVSQILTREGDTIRETKFVSNDNKSEQTTQSPSNGAYRIINGESNLVAILPNERKMEVLCADRQIPMPSDVLIVPGSFNPPHIGHAQLANAAVAALKRTRQSETENSSHPSKSLHSMTSSVSSSSSIMDSIWNTIETTSNKQYDPTVLFEMSVTNVDKPPIDPEEVERRVNLFTSIPSSDLPNDWGVILTNAPLFSQKTEIIDHMIEGIVGVRKMTFVIGTDTMVRIIDPKYYGHSQSNMIAALEDMKRKGVHFIVGGRLEQGTDERPRFINGKDEHESLPQHVQQMFTLLEENEFRVDISSTELRKNLEASKIAS
ncbi:hypothetical protein ACHAWO_004186 [Cyclotella atomus]|uniref:Cytidyltransferase-like domain-containing protein n=1 Tax=Cyclotella atomus TaxID=382360 RepID=A0ABD3NW97_9STRA